MVVQNNISVFWQKVFTLSAVFCTALAVTSMAQSHEGDRNMPEPRVEEHFGMESPEAIQEYNTPRVSERVNPVKEKQSTPRASNNIYKQGGEKDVRKDNVSTLSFNLFLYIVDKFKEND
ncbi:hypothetical protein KIH41_12190 [Litoribacter ruber]|uniref:Uncharacterized protein n=1 Tax=Litoribacter ruber TaxID=702568 RepID=A0AAP2CFE3_9BACT|nr:MULTISPECIES: hypothetical protein [Litoribacter]MBS9523548.1 hypothetical protein [Litoribacter alkaliphilus]MBT0812035.1 hypothetical protein [Litoribacter ruber]